VITVVVPVYNGVHFVDEALASIDGQRHPDLEVVLVDDGSTDGLPELAARLPAHVRYLRQDNSGPAAARNLGIRSARGELIAFLDVDDRWTPGHLERLEQALRKSPEAGIAQGRIRQVVVALDGSEHLSGPYRMPYLGSCLFRRWVFDRCGCFDEQMRRGEDYDLMCRAWEQDIPKCLVDEVSLLYRRHGANLTQDDPRQGHVVVLKKRLERIRAGKVDATAPRRAVFQDYIGDIEDFAPWSH